MKTLYITCKVEYPDKYPEADILAALEALLESTSSKVRKNKREAARRHAEQLLKHALFTREEVYRERKDLDQPGTDTMRFVSESDY
jgi:hypothetical protein